MNASFPTEFTVPSRITAFIDHAPLAAGDGHVLPVVNPANERTVSELEESDASVVDRAVRAARRAFNEGPWPRMEVGERQAILRRLATLIREHARELAYLECLSSGIPMRHLSLGQIPRAALNFEFFAEFIGQCAGQVYSQDPRYMTFVTREPVGVAALIGPWNAPLALTSMKIAGCIAFGNCCVAKPAEQTPLAVARLMDLIVAAGVPAGVVNMVCGRGAVTGEALIRHPEVDLISFTGGTATGRTVMAAAGAGLKPCSLELGGKSANIVFASADLERAVGHARPNAHRGTRIPQTSRTPQLAGKMTLGRPTMPCPTFGIGVPTSNRTPPPLRIASSRCREPSSRRRCENFPPLPTNSQAKLVVLRGNNRWIVAVDSTKGLREHHRVATASFDLTERRIPLKIGQAVIDGLIAISFAPTAVHDSDTRLFSEHLAGVVQPARHNLTIPIDELNKPNRPVELQQPLNTRIASSCRREWQRQVQLDDFHAHGPRQLNAPVHRIRINVHYRKASPCH